jgi:hypothetical protein
MPERIFDPLVEQITACQAERITLEKWQKQPIDLHAVRAWIDGRLSTAWGKLAAARLWSICTTGHDAAFIPPFEALPASYRHVKPSQSVPGAPAESRTLYDVAQAASWIASRRSDFEQGQTMQQEIHDLLTPLAN